MVLPMRRTYWFQDLEMELARVVLPYEATFLEAVIQHVRYNLFYPSEQYFTSRGVSLRMAVLNDLYVALGLEV